VAEPDGFRTWLIMLGQCGQPHGRRQTGPRATRRHYRSTQGQEDRLGQRQLATSRLVVHAKQRRPAYYAVMSSEAVGRHMPTVVTLDDLTEMMAADESHRYEISPEGVLSIMPPPGYAHAIIATRLTVWLAAAGVPVDRIAQAVGLRIPGRGGAVGGRIPDLVVWSKPQSDAVWLPVADVLLVVEIMSPGSEGTDLVTKHNEYAAAGIPQYWIVDQDPAQTVTMHRLTGDRFTVHATMPLAWVLNTSPDEHNLC
jgi:Uma2 family endonuclease